MIGKTFFGILAVFLLLGVFATPINNGIKGWRATNTTQSFEVVTAAGVVSANVTLGHNLYQNDVSSTGVIGITSNTTDTPVADSYVSESKKLLVIGLLANTTRLLTVNYYAEDDSPVMLTLGPFLSLLLFGGLLAGIMIGIFHKGRR